jgi:hypothetical protein
MKKQTVILIHCIFWFYRIGWIDFIGQFFSKDITFEPTDFLRPLLLSNLLISFFIFYCNYLFVLPRYFKTKQYGKAWIGWISLLALWIGLRYLVEEIMFTHYLGISNYSSGTTVGYYIFDNIYWGLPSLIASFLIWLINDLINTEKENARLQEEKRNAEVSFLRSQINPHFIFNTMNNIYSLVYHKSEKALPAIEKLSGIMRYVMKDNEGNKIELIKEIDYLKDFIELQSLRSVGEASVKFTIEGDPEGKMIAPLLLVAFVENGFKHGVVNDDENPFLIKLAIAKNNLTFRCSNKIAGGKKDESSGIGLQNVKRRLELLYPGQYQLNIDQSNKQYTITLNIEL